LGLSLRWLSFQVASSYGSVLLGIEVPGQTSIDTL